MALPTVKQILDERIPLEVGSGYTVKVTVPATDQCDAVSELIAYEGKMVFEFQNKQEAKTWANDLSERAQAEVVLEDQSSQQSDDIDGYLVPE